MILRHDDDYATLFGRFRRLAITMRFSTSAVFFFSCHVAIIFRFISEFFRRHFSRLPSLAYAIRLRLMP